MFSIEVYTMIGGERLTRFLVFESYTSAANFYMTLKSRREGRYSPEDYFEAAEMSRYKRGEKLGEAIETDFVLTYLEKTKK